MSRFVVRIELRDSESADYDELHEKLASHGFKRTILNSDYDPVWLPNAEYLYETETNGIYYVGHLAKVVSEKIRPNPKVLVTEVKELFFIDLDKA